MADTIRYSSFAKLAQSRGHTLTWGAGHDPWCSAVMAMGDGFMEEPFQLYPKALPEYPWDVLSLQPFDRHIDGTDGDLAAARNQSRCEGDGAGLAQLDDNEMDIQAHAAQAGIFAGGLPADGWGNALQDMQYQL